MEDFAYGGVSNPDAVLTVKDSSDEKVTPLGVVGLPSCLELGQAFILKGTGFFLI